MSSNGSYKDYEYDEYLEHKTIENLECNMWSKKIGALRAGEQEQNRHHGFIAQGASTAA
jgi:hypothetical protein